MEEEREKSGSGRESLCSSADKQAEGGRGEQRTQKTIHHCQDPGRAHRHHDVDDEDEERDTSAVPQQQGKLLRRPICSTHTHQTRRRRPTKLCSVPSLCLSLCDRDF